MFFPALLLVCAFGMQDAKASKGDKILTANEVILRAEEFLQDQLSFAKNPVEIEIIFNERDIEIPADDISIKFQIMGQLKEMGRNFLIGKIMADGKFFRQFSLNAKTTAFVNVVRAVRPIKRGEIISEELVSVEQVKTIRPLRNTVSRVEDILGKEATRNLQMGRNISFNFIKTPPLVDRGDRIMIVAQKGAMKITTPGMARQKGTKDSMIPVMNLQSKKIVYARVVDKNTVEVNF